MAMRHKGKEYGMTRGCGWQRGLLSAVAGTLAFAAWADGVFAPAVTVTFTDTRTIAAHVQALGKGTPDLLLNRSIPAALVGSPAARLFGPMRPGANGVAVCYVDSQVIARILATPANAAGRKKREADLQRAKHWTLFYPATVPQAAFLKSHPTVRGVQGCLAIPPPQGQPGPTLYALYSPDGKWVALSVSPVLTRNVASVAAPALKRPLGNDLAFIQMGPAGSRALFQTDACAGGAISVRMGPAGLELDGTVRMKAGPYGGVLPAAAFAFPRIPATAPLFGATTSGQDIRSAEEFAIAGPEVSNFVRRSLVQGRAPGGAPAAYHLPAWSRPGKPPPKAVGMPRARFAAILPEALRRNDLENVMFCSPTEVLRQSLPRIAATLPMTEAVQLEVGIRLLKPVRGHGLGFMSWRQGANERFFIRISRDELRGTAGLWSSLFL